MRILVYLYVYNCYIYDINSKNTYTFLNILLFHYYFNHKTNLSSTSNTVTLFVIIFILFRKTKIYLTNYEFI